MPHRLTVYVYREGYVCGHSGARWGDRVKRLMVLPAQEGETVWQEEEDGQTLLLLLVPSFSSSLVISLTHTHNSGVDTYTNHAAASLDSCQTR